MLKHNNLLKRKLNDKHVKKRQSEDQIQELTKHSPEYNNLKDELTDLNLIMKTKTMAIKFHMDDLQPTLLSTTTLGTRGGACSPPPIHACPP
jgi:hypothetical protein